jgi:hypothetical protein
MYYKEKHRSFISYYVGHSNLNDLSNKESGVKVNAKGSKYMLMMCEKNAGQYHKVKIGNKSSKSVEQFKYLGTTLTNRTELQECLLSFGVEYFVFHFAIQMYKD